MIENCLHPFIKGSINLTYSDSAHNQMKITQFIYQSKDKK